MLAASGPAARAGLRAGDRVLTVDGRAVDDAQDLRERIRIGCAGKVVSAFDIARMIALGADWCNSARGFMFALGCIQSRSCHTDHCPTGVATQDPVRQRAIVVTDKAERVFHFHANTLNALAELLGAAGLQNPGQISPAHVMQRTANGQARPLASQIDTLAPACLLDPQARPEDWPLPFSSDWAAARAEAWGPVHGAP